MMRGGENILSNRIDQKSVDDVNAKHLGVGSFGGA